ncbi:MAG: DUF2142 domain-containing protein [Candidatus Aphodocola sp.]
MKKGSNKKVCKILLILISFGLACLTILSGILYDISRKKVEINIKSLTGKNYISEIKIGETNYYISDFSEKYNLKLIDKEKNKNSNEDDRLLLDEGEELNFEINFLHDISIYFDKKMSNGKVEIKYGKTTEYINTNSAKSKDYFVVFNTLSTLIKDYVNNFNIANYIIISLLILLFCFIYKMLINKILNIINSVKKNDKINIWQIIFCFIIYFLINILCMLPVIEVLNKWYFIIIILQVVAIVYYLKDLIKNKLHYIFLFLAIILCVNISILIPPFHVPDEFSHYLKAYSIFNKDDVKIEDGKHYIKIYDDTYNTIQKYTYDLHSSEYRMTIKEYFTDLSIYAKGSKETKVNFENTATLNSFAYIPSAIVIKISLICGFPFILSTLFGRIINALIFIVLGFLAIKIIPFFKKIFFLVMLFPITIQQVTAVNQDSITLSIIFFLLAIILKEILDKEKYISKKNITLIIILSVFLGMCKPVYFLIVLLILLIPNKKFETRNEAILFKVLPIALCFVFSLYKFFQAGSNAIETTQGNFVTVAYAIKHPFEIIKIFLITFNSRGSLDLLTGQLNGFGWHTIYYDYLTSFFIIANLYVILLISDNDSIKQLTLCKRIFIFLIGFIILMFIYASTLVGFSLTKIGSEVIDGLQPRYFIPITLLFLVSISSNFIRTNFKNKNIPAIILIILNYSLSFYMIIKGFYL